MTRIESGGGGEGDAGEFAAEVGGVALAVLGVVQDGVDVVEDVPLADGGIVVAGAELLERPVGDVLVAVGPVFSVSVEGETLKTVSAAAEVKLGDAGGHIAMKGRITRTTSETRTKGKTDFKRWRRMRDADIDDSDIPKLDKSFWKTAKLTMPEPKDRLTIRVDHDVVEWLKKAGSGYQTRINALLRSYMKAQAE